MTGLGREAPPRARGRGLSRSIPAWLLFAAVACAGAQRDLCRTLETEQRALAEKSRECEALEPAPTPGQCAQAAPACSDADRKLLAAEAACVQNLPRCIDPQACKGDSCGDATPGAMAGWREQRDGCRRLAADVSAKCKAALQGSRGA